MDQSPQPPTDLPELPEGLRRFVEAARTQPVAPTQVTADAVAAGLELRRRRNHARRLVTLSATMAVAASLVAVGLIWPLLSSRDHAESPATTHATTEVVSEVEAPRLAGAVRVRSTSAVEVRGPWSIALRDGVHEIEVDPVPDHRLAIALPGRSLELVEGSVTIDLEQEQEGLVAVRLHSGVAAWIDEHGERTQIIVERIDFARDPGARDPGEASEPASVEPDSRTAAPTAAELSRQAEQRLAAGDSEGAIAIYRQLVRKHPRASQTRSAVVDLARLLRADGRKDEARCAYRLYLERWPDSAVRGEVESQLDRLGAGPACRGLDPR